MVKYLFDASEVSADWCWEGGTPFFEWLEGDAGILPSEDWFFIWELGIKEVEHPHDLRVLDCQYGYAVVDRYSVLCLLGHSDGMDEQALDVLVSHLGFRCVSPELLEELDEEAEMDEDGDWLLGDGEIALGEEDLRSLILPHGEIVPCDRRYSSVEGYSIGVTVKEIIGWVVRHGMSAPRAYSLINTIKWGEDLPSLRKALHI